MVQPLCYHIYIYYIELLSLALKGSYTSYTASRRISIASGLNRSQSEARFNPVRGYCFACVVSRTVQNPTPSPTPERDSCRWYLKPDANLGNPRNPKIGYLEKHAARCTQRSARGIAIAARRTLLGETGTGSPYPDGVMRHANEESMLTML